MQKSRLQERRRRSPPSSKPARRPRPSSATLFGELIEAEARRRGYQDLVKATQRTQLQALTAPVDGAVQQLAVHTVGGVVTPAQSLLVVVPSDSHLEVEAMLSNRDIGFVHPGQDVQIKVDTFTFTRYGLIHGRVVSVSQDAIARESRRISRTKKEPRPRERLQRAERAGTRLTPRGSRSTHANANRRKSRQPLGRNGGHGGDQDRLAYRHDLPALAHHALQARQLRERSAETLPIVNALLHAASR